jgi:hypothetical protein
MLAPAILAFALMQPAADWPLDVLKLSNGATLRGLVLEDTPVGVRFKVVKRPPGRPTVTLTTYLTRAEIAGLTKIAEADRAAVLEKLAELDPTGSAEAKRGKEIVLSKGDWPGAPGAALRYDADTFVLLSTATEEVTRRAAVRLEQIATAYARFLPVQSKPGKPVTVFLADDAAQYRAAAGGVFNPALYDPVQNRIVCGTDLRQAGLDLRAARLKSAQQFAALDKYEADIRKLYKQRTELDRFLEPLKKDRQKLWAAERTNDATFDAAAARLFSLLYHETFHAYAATAGFAAPLPRWLNEGMAQIFETAVLEGGELRVGHADAQRLARAQAELKGMKWVPTKMLLTAAADRYLVGHGTATGQADAIYLNAWAQATYLTFERRLIAGPGFEQYLTAANADPVAAFEKWVGKDVDAYDRDLRMYVDKLTANGTLRK